MNEPPPYLSIATTLAVCHALNKGVQALTFDAFSQAVVKVTGEMKDALLSYQRFKSNPLQWLGECQPRELAVKIVEILLEKGVAES